jgi:hypothetical protein
MDLIGQLSQQLGVDSSQAQGLAGSLLKMVQHTVTDRVGPDAAAQMDRSIPEMQGWQQAAAPAEPSGGGGMMGALGGLLGGGGQGASGGGGLGGMLGGLGGAVAQAGEVAGIVALLQRFNIDGGKAALVAPLLLNFLKSRLDPALLGRILPALPMLANLGGGGTPGGGAPGGGLGGMLGGLLK